MNEMDAVNINELVQQVQGWVTSGNTGCEVDVDAMVNNNDMMISYQVFDVVPSQTPEIATQLV